MKYLTIANDDGKHETISRSKYAKLLNDYLEPEHAELLTSKRVDPLRTYSLYVAETGQHFVQIRRGQKTTIIPVTNNRALRILHSETYSRIERMLKAKLGTIRRGDIDGVKYDTAKDTPIAYHRYGPMEVAMSYLTQEGHEYIRAVSALADGILTYDTNASGIGDILEFWFTGVPSFLDFVDFLSSYASYGPLRAAIKF